MNGFVVEGGAKLGQVYRKLFLGWGVMVPADESPEIGTGGPTAARQRPLGSS